MPDLDLKKITDNLINVFLYAGEEAKKIANSGIKITIKEDDSPVTNGDLAVDKIIRNEIAILTPNIPIISEETVNLKVKNNNKNFWLIDPIDGTKDYIKNKDEYTINAALIINSKVTVGLINAPKKNRMFFTYGDGRAFHLKNDVTTQINGEKKTEKGKVFALTNSNTPSDDVLNILNQNNVTKMTKVSSSLKFCLIASGEADIYTCRARAYEWDVAAGHALVINSGGTFTTPDNKEINYGKNDYKNPPLLVKRSSNLKI